MHQRSRRLTLGLAVAALAVACASCDGNPPPAQAAPPTAPPPVPATVVQVVPQRVPIVLQSVGTTEGSKEVEVRSRVAGILETRVYREGAPISAGAPMFRIERAPFEIAIGQARAQGAESEARLAQARRDEERFRPLVEQGYVSRKAYDDARSAVEFAQAQIKQSQAAMREAELNLSYTVVTAPVRGIAGRAQRSEGTLVTTTPDGSLLTTINQVNPIWVRFSLSQSDVDRVPGGRLSSLQNAPVHIVQQDGKRYPIAGRVNFAASEIDPRLATQQVRAEFPNPDESLLPGEFVRVELAAGEMQDVFLVPQNAIVQTEKGQFVFVVDADDKAALRPVETGEWRGSDWVVRRGLQAGDRVIVDNLLKLRPGVPVTPIAVPGEAPVASSGGTSATQR